MATVSSGNDKPEGPAGNPFSGEAGIPENTGAEGVGTANNVPNDDESAQQPRGYNDLPEVEGPVSTPAEDEVAPANYVATDGDVQGDGRSTQDLKDKRVIDPAAPFDYNTLPDGSDVQGNHYPPGADFFKKQLEDAQAAQVAAQAQMDAAEQALKEAEKAHEENGPIPTEATTGESVLPVNDATTEAVDQNDNSE